MKLKCQRCKRTWNYKGKNEYYAPCSKCKTSVSIKKHMVEKD
jgi:tRNA(Ile2) C34 agmatinyltransferase TiaS